MIFKHDSAMTYKCNTTHFVKAQSSFLQIAKEIKLQVAGLLGCCYKPHYIHCFCILVSPISAVIFVIVPISKAKVLNGISIATKLWCHKLHVKISTIAVVTIVLSSLVACFI